MQARSHGRWGRDRKIGAAGHEAYGADRFLIINRTWKGCVCAFEDTVGSFGWEDWERCADSVRMQQCLAVRSSGCCLAEAAGGVQLVYRRLRYDPEEVYLLFRNECWTCY